MNLLLGHELFELSKYIVIVDFLRCHFLSENSFWSSICTYCPHKQTIRLRMSRAICFHEFSWFEIRLWWHGRWSLFLAFQRLSPTDLMVSARLELYNIEISILFEIEPHLILYGHFHFSLFLDFSFVLNLKYRFIYKERFDSLQVILEVMGQLFVVVFQRLRFHSHHGLLRTTSFACAVLHLYSFWVVHPCVISRRHHFCRIKRIWGFPLYLFILPSEAPIVAIYNYLIFTP